MNFIAKHRYKKELKQLAIVALKEMLSSPEHCTGKLNPAFIAEDAFDIAEAMMKELKKRTQ